MKFVPQTGNFFLSHEVYYPKFVSNAGYFSNISFLGCKIATKAQDFWSYLKTLPESSRLPGKILATLPAKLPPWSMIMSVNTARLCENPSNYIRKHLGLNNHWTREIKWNRGEGIKNPPEVENRVLCLPKILYFSLKLNLSSVRNKAYIYYIYALFRTDYILYNLLNTMFWFHFLYV